MREARAVVLGLLVVLLAAMAIHHWRAPARDYRRVGGYRVEIRKLENGETRRVSFTVPMTFVARIVSMVPVSEIGGNVRATWGEGSVTPKEILAAADRSTPGQPGLISSGHSKVEVARDGAALEISVTDDWDKHVRIRVPRVLVESISADRNVSPREILKKLDELGPGDVVSVHDGDKEVTITARGR